MLDVTAGMITMGYAVAGLFFLRFWRRTGDRLFLAFCCAFWLFALNQVAIPLSGLAREEASGFYLLRLAGFVLIIIAILSKNGAGREPR